MTGKDPEVENAGWIVSIWIVGQVLSMIHCAASLFLTYAVCLFLWHASNRGNLAIGVEFCTVVWMLGVSYVGLQQIRFSWNKILTREIAKSKNKSPSTRE